ncbi:MAG: hypothetical protein A3F84_02660 [Candidatus Handelsmanbacteria bacterium RIFCSPLOWO2_12_FULL_64_10]|uniref:DUF6259 domain-containing protein n=1 Tax=Handelsmanbacteria sp. (strain RIFCSPLOWO2_12_FULL_64_10) TaxID=1817868 RepID=A0A1F6CLV0_HANXR|nr:MAG: hypothetical protein A3F84_02660 [Candidatus Handelsmanbacteria bacterium RIFCSPLOWO2_12_FULL_64_10]
MDKLVWNTFKPLRTAQADEGIVVEGGTFRYVFSGGSGLMSSVRILGREWLSGGHPLPDLWTADAVHPRGREYQAAKETRARVTLARARPEQVIIRAQGRYLDRQGTAFPLEYSLSYTVDVDGMVKVEVENRATGRGALRWLVFSKGTMPARLVEFINHSEDLARVEARTGAFLSEAAPQADGTALSGRFFPWLQFGNDTAGLDLTVDEADEIAYGVTDSRPYRDGLGNAGATCEVFRKGGQVSYEYFSIRNLYTPLSPGWTRRNRFYVGVVPAKPYDPALSDIRIHWMGPHQINPNFVYPTNEEIAGFAREGVNILLGCAHWRSGHYSRPLEPGETQRVIRACHRHGLRIIPYITFTDLDHPTPAFQAHGQEWQIEPVAEFRHLTNLMCYGAEGWREYWKREVETIFERFDFDGLYIDFWVGKMACFNPRHGCNRRYGRYTLPGIRDMAMDAFRRVKAQGAGHFILSNTNLFAGAMINNFVDIRLPGEWGNIEETPPEVVRGYLNSRRLGCNSLMLGGRIPRFTLRSISLSLRCQSPMTGWRRRRPAERRLFMKYADILRCFGVSRAESLGAWEEDGSLSAAPKDLVTYWYRNDRGVLVVGVDMAGRVGRRRIRVEDPARLGLHPRRAYLLYRPDAGRMLSDGPVAAQDVGWLSAELRAWEPLLVFLAPAKGRPQTLWATFSDGVEGEGWDGRKGALALTVKGVEGGETTVTVYAAGRRVVGATQGSKRLRHRAEGELVRLRAPCNRELSVRFES